MNLVKFKWNWTKLKKNKKYSKELSRTWCYQLKRHQTDWKKLTSTRQNLKIRSLKESKELNLISF